MRKKNISKIEKSKVFDEKYYRGKKKSYINGYNFLPRYKNSIPIAKTFLKLGVTNALDVGCATGPLVKALIDVGIKAYGVDVSEWAVKNSPVADRLHWLDIEEDELMFPNEFFDIVISTYAIEHFHYPEKALRDIFRVLKPKGYLYLVTDKPESFTSGQVGHINIRSKKMWLKLLRDIGFSTSKSIFIRFMLHYPYEKVCFETGPIAKKLLLDRMGFIGRRILWFFRSIKYILERRESTYFLLIKK